MFVDKETREVNPSSRESDVGLDDASKLLLKAAAIMERRGKCGPENFCGVDDKGRLCAFQAINDAAGKHQEDVVVPRRKLAALFGGDERKVMEWSDNSPQETVIATMRRVALSWS